MGKSQNKTIATASSVIDFLNDIKDAEKKADCLRLNTIMERITNHSAKMWGGSIVGFDTYHYVYDSGRQGNFMKVGFSPRAQNLSVYIMPGFDRYPLLMEKLGKHKLGKSCLYIKRLSDVDMDVLEELIKEAYDHMTKKYG